MKKLYQNKYQYRIVLVLSGAYMFRGNNLDKTEKDTLYFNDTDDISDYRKDINLNSILPLIGVLRIIEDYALRVEGCYLSIYVSSEIHVKWIEELDNIKIKEIYSPKTELIAGTIVSTLPYDFKVHIRVSKDTDYGGFVKWAKNNKKLRVTDSAMAALEHQPYQYAYYYNVYFYIIGEKNLTAARIHLGSAIKKIEKIINTS